MRWSVVNMGFLYISAHFIQILEKVFGEKTPHLTIPVKDWKTSLFCTDLDI